MLRLSFYPVGDSYLLVVVAALVLLGLLAVRASRRGIGWPKRATLIGLRAAVVAMLIVAMLRPTLVYTETKTQSATLLVLIDQSRSMSIPDGTGGKTRWETLRRAVASAEDELEKLAEDFELKVYTFNAEAHAAAIDGGKLALGDTPEGKQTAIGAVLQDVLGEQEKAAKRLLGVILLSDGAQRALAPRDLPPQTAAARLKRLGYPLFTFPFGQSLRLGRVQDVAVTQLPVNQSVFVKNQLGITGQVRVDGYVHREIPVRVLFETAPGKMEVVAQENVIATADGQLVPIRLSYAPQQAGEHKLTLEAVEQPGELVATNNRMSTFVHVLKGGLNVLYLEGTLRRETKFLRRALDASPDINVDYLRIDPRHDETRPGNMAERFQPGKYDVYILGDLDSTAFRGDELKRLAEAVERGAGLIMLGGFHSFGPGGYAETPLAAVLPVRISSNERQRFGDPDRHDVHLRGPLKIQPTELGLSHFALMLAGSREENEALWAKLPPLEGANRFANSRLAPQAVVLASAGRGIPILIYHNYGAGRVVAFAGDSTWRWQMQGHGSAHRRFWRQMILWLGRKDQTSDGNVWVRLAKRRFAPGERVEFTAGAQSAAGEPIAGADYQAQVVLPDGTRRPLRVVREGDQVTSSLRDAQAAGDYAIEVTATHEGAILGSARARFLVFEQDLELDNAAADAASLESLAAMTDGESLAPEQLPELIRRLAQRTSDLEIEQETKATFWDTWPFFLVLVGLLGIDWYLRKRWGLV